MTDATGNARERYSSIKKDEVWRAFKIILVLRRTTGHNLGGISHFAAKIKENGNDYTGYFDIWRIWKKKKHYIWDNYLAIKHDTIQSKEVIEILDWMMNDNPSSEKIVGTSYQERISPLMNMGIRRSAGTQAYTAINVWEICNKTYSSYINYKTLKDLLINPNANRYMYRTALLEIHHKWMIISTDSSNRFEKLLIGKLSDVKNSEQKDNAGNFIKFRKVNVEQDAYCVTYVRRILSYLSHFPYDNTEIFETKSLYEIMRNLFINPNGKDKSPKKTSDNKIDFMPLSKVLISLGDTLHKETKGAEMIVLDVDDERFDSDNLEEQFAIILEEIWIKGERESNTNGKYKSSKFGARLTDAGLAFLTDIQPSFSFFAALYCSEEVPLFFLRDINRIQLVIKMVYDNAKILCDKYEKVARGFCGIESKLSVPNSKFLYKHHDEYITFKTRVIELHIQHLTHYKDFLNKNSTVIGFSAERLLTNDGKDYIAEYINKYKTWKDTSNKGETVCF